MVQRSYSRGGYLVEGSCQCWASGRGVLPEVGIWWRGPASGGYLVEGSCQRWASGSLVLLEVDIW